MNAAGPRSNMWKRSRRWLSSRCHITRRSVLSLSSALALVPVSLSGCGGSQSASDVVARVDGRPITRALLSHWTATFVRGDYYAVTRKKAPVGLASNPPDYGACVSAAKKVRPPTAARPPLTEAQLSERCHVLYATVEREALGYLITVMWSEGQAKERGYTITAADIAERIAQTQRESYPKRDAFANYLVSKGWTRADLNVIVRRNLLEGEVLKALEAKAGKGPKSEGTLASLLEENARKWTSKTSCSTGYVVQQCRQYRGVTPKTQSAAVIFEEMMGSTTH